MSDKKFHIGKNGPAQCKATKRACRLGGASGKENHFATLDEANEAWSKMNEKQIVNEIPEITEIEGVTDQELIKRYNNLEKEYFDLENELNREKNILDSLSRDMAEAEEKLESARAELYQDKEFREKYNLDEVDELKKQGYMETVRIEHKRPLYTVETKEKLSGVPIPKLYLRGIDTKYSKILQDHVLKHKFGKQKGLVKAPDTVLTEKDIAWINDFKKDPEKGKQVLAQLNANLEAAKRVGGFNYGFGDISETSSERAAKEANESLSEYKKEYNSLSSEHLNQMGTVSTIENRQYQINQKQNNLKRVQRRWDSYKKFDFKENDIVKKSSTGGAQSIDRDLISTNENGEINNIFIKYDKPDGSVELKPVTEITDKGYLVDSDGRSHHAHLRQHGMDSFQVSRRDELVSEDLIIIKKRGNDYNGPTDLITTQDYPVW